MTRVQRALAISPHLDDAALSAGAFLAQLALAGVDVHVLTVFAGAPVPPLSPVARRFHDDCSLSQDATAIAARRAEDRKAIGVLGGEAHHLDLLDAVYRRRADGRWLCDHDRAMFDRNPDNQDVAAALEVITRWCRLLEPDLVLTCAGVGDHVDHVLTRQAVTRARHTTGAELLLWEDLPYAVGVPRHNDAVVPTLEPASPTAWRRKWTAIASYPTQLRMLWPNDCDWVAALHGHALEVGVDKPAERLWRWPASHLWAPPASELPESGA